MNHKRDYYQEERDRIAKHELKASKAIFRVERGLDGMFHLYGMLRNGKIIHEVFETNAEAVRVGQILEQHNQ